MRAVRCHDHHVAVVDLPDPTGDGVLVRVASAGICGSDLHMVDLYDMRATLGHEFAGFLPDGRLVAVEPLGACRSCAACRAGRPYHCERGLRMYGGALDGGMADASCAVLGGGTIGLCLVPAVQAAGVDHVELVARHDHQGAAGVRLRAALADPEPARWDVVFDAVGTAESLAQAIDMVRPGGRVVIVGLYWDGDVPMPGLAFCMKEVRLIASMMYGSHSGGRDFVDAARLLAERPEIAPTLITHRFPLDAAADAFACARDRQAGAIKVVLEP